MGVSEVAFSSGMDSYEKELDNIAGRTSRPVMGIWLPNDGGSVIFPPYAMPLYAEADVSGTNYYGENGHHSARVRNANYAFGVVDGDELSLTIVVTSDLGEITIEAEFVQPPQAP